MCTRDDVTVTAVASPVGSAQDSVTGRPTAIDMEWPRRLLDEDMPRIEQPVIGLPLAGRDGDLDHASAAAPIERTRHRRVRGAAAEPERAVVTDRQHQILGRLDDGDVLHLERDVTCVGGQSTEHDDLVQIAPSAGVAEDLALLVCRARIVAEGDRRLVTVWAAER